MPTVDPSHPPNAAVSAGRPLLVLELFAGIGGAAAALAGFGRPSEVTAIDVSPKAIALYRHLFPEHRAETALIDTLGTDRLAGYRADLWWLSPPCQPYTRRGLGQDLADPRSAGLRHLIDQIPRVRPRCVALENVPGFAGSDGHRRLRNALENAGYETSDTTLCPTELGIPNRRRRFYLVASREGLAPPSPRPEEAVRPLHHFLDPDLRQGPPPPELAVSPELVRRYPHALSRVSPDESTSACFTAAYGRSPVRSGSYLELPDGSLRRFSPAEILRLLGFPPHLALPPGTVARDAWPLVGNSLSVPAVRRVLERLPPFAPHRAERASSEVAR